MPNGTYGGVRGRKTKVGGKLLLRFPPTRFLKSYFRIDCVPFIVKYPKAYYFVSATVEYVTLPSFPSLLSVSA